jgi:hypothetical protein
MNVVCQNHFLIAGRVPIRQPAVPVAMNKRGLKCITKG